MKWGSRAPWRPVCLTAIAASFVGSSLSCSYEAEDRRASANGTLRTALVTTAPPPEGGVSSVPLQLEVATYACAINQVLNAFQVTNTGTSPVRLSDISIRFWANDTTAQQMVAGINYGGCLNNARGCYHQVTGATASAASFSPACGPDAAHQANWEITVSTTDTAMLNPGGVWNGLQTTAHLAGYGLFSPGAATWYSQCQGASSQYASDPHYSIYYQGKLVYASGLNAPSCRAPHGSQQLSGYATPEIASRPVIGRVPGSTPIHLAVSLPLRDSAGLKQFIRDVSDPTNPATYRQYLTPAQFAATYGPLASDYQDLTDWATSRGLTIARSYSNHMLLDVHGPASAVEQALYVNLDYRERPDGSQFYAPDREPSLDLNTEVLRVSQLDNLFVPQPMVDQSTGRLLGPDDFHGIYASCYPNLDGNGQSIGLLSYSAYYDSDIEAYQAAAGIPSNQYATVTAVSVDGFSTVPDASSQVTEPALDIEMALSMAPRAHIYMFEAAPAITSSNSLLNTMATTTPLILQLSSSWGIFNDATTQQILDQFAAQGQSYFQPSGDSGAFPPEMSPYFSLSLSNVTIVGGTSPDIEHGTEYYYTGESGWSGSGGGVLPAVAIPSYQPTMATTNYSPSSFFPAGPSLLANRMLPDVAAFASRLDCYADGAMLNSGGTSASTPLWAGFMALVNQQNALNGLPPVGFANPALYYIGTSANYESCFNDIQDGTLNPNTSGIGSPAEYEAVQGYDMVTGWGSPKCGLITTLSTPCTASQTDPNNCGACWHSCQGGTCSSGVCQPFQLTTSYHPLVPVGYHQLAVTREMVFATGTAILSHGQNEGLLESVTLNGTDYTTYVQGNQATHVIANASDAYWIVDGIVHDLDLETGIDDSWDLVGSALFVDPSFLYVSGYNDEYVYSFSKNTPTSPHFIAADVSSPAGIAVSGAPGDTATIFWASSKNADDDPLSGTISSRSWAYDSTPTVLATGQDYPTDVATDGNFVYWINWGQETHVRSIHRVPVSGGSPTTLATFAWGTHGGGWGSIAIDRDSVYYVDSETMNLVRMAKDGSGSTILTTGLPTILGIAVDSTSVYWLTTNGIIMKLAK